MTSIRPLIKAMRITWYMFETQRVVCQKPSI